jgi:hypothetical protein
MYFRQADAELLGGLLGGMEFVEGHFAVAGFGSLSGSQLAEVWDVEALVAGLAEDGDFDWFIGYVMPGKVLVGAADEASLILEGDFAGGEIPASFLPFL